MIMLTILAHLFPRLRTHPLLRIGAPLGMEQSVAQPTLLAARHSEPIVMQALDEGLIPQNPVCRALTAQSQLSQHLTPSHHWVTLMVESNPTPVPLTSFLSETLTMTVQKRRRDHLLDRLFTVRHRRSPHGRCARQGMPG